MAKFLFSLSTRVKIFLTVFIFGLAISFTGSFISYLLRVDQSREFFISTIEGKVLHSEEMLHRGVNDLKNALLLTSSYISDNIYSVAPGLTDGVQTHMVESYMLLIARMMQDITQFRYIDSEGREVIRVERVSRESSAELIPKHLLQDKGHRYYFSEVMKLKDGDIWISDLDLNVEHKLIEMPEKPVIRIATPVVKDGQKAGMLIINYFADYFLKNFSSINYVDIFLADGRGHYIYHPDSSKQFAKDKKINANIMRDFPFVADMEGDGIVHPSDSIIAKKISLGGGRNLLAVYKLNKNYMRNIHFQQIFISFTLYLAAGIFSFFFSYYVARFSAGQYDLKVQEIMRLQEDTENMKNSMSELKDSAYLDPLTGAFNRRYYDEKINTYLQTNVRFGLIMLDLDNFKRVNDSLGHEAGDKVLCGFTELVLSNIRDTDFLTRWGGDEFCLIIFDVSRNVLLSISEKLRRLTEQHDFKVGMDMTCSVGVSHRKSGESIEKAFEKADSALYDAKKNGRNIVIYKD